MLGNFPWFRSLSPWAVLGAVVSSVFVLVREWVLFRVGFSVVNWVEVGIGVGVLF